CSCFAGIFLGSKKRRFCKRNVGSPALGKKKLIFKEFFEDAIELEALDPPCTAGPFQGEK
ncbi:MAG: hypothetical protein AB7O96_12690, partial [Pseudobdellovibrionaceae bacterium]